MIALLQRVRQAHVMVAAEVASACGRGSSCESGPADPAGVCVGRIGAGLLVLVCAEPQDTAATGERLLAKVLGLRIFSDADGRMNHSLAQTGGGLLLVSQFTLAADTTSGMRPGFKAAAPPAQARLLYDQLVAAAQAANPHVQTGIFGADMQVHLVNDGPVTIPLRMQ